MDADRDGLSTQTDTHTRHEYVTDVMITRCYSYVTIQTDDIPRYGRR